MLCKLTLMKVLKDIRSRQWLKVYKDVTLAPCSAALESLAKHQHVCKPHSNASSSCNSQHDCSCLLRFSIMQGSKVSGQLNVRSHLTKFYLKNVWGFYLEIGACLQLEKICVVLQIYGDWSQHTWICFAVYSLIMLATQNCSQCLIIIFGPTRE